MKRYDLMHQINTRGTFLVSKLCIPHLKKAANPHILNLSPPLDMKAKWFKGHVAYTMAKFGMSMCTLGMSAEFARDGIAVNSLWPLTAIDTAAVRNLLGGDSVAAMSRSPEIMADAAYAIFNRPSRETTGNFFIDEEVLREEGVTRFLDLRAGGQGAAGRRLLRAGRGVRTKPDQGCARLSGEASDRVSQRLRQTLPDRPLDILPAIRTMRLASTVASFHGRITDGAVRPVAWLSATAMSHFQPALDALVIMATQMMPCSFVNAGFETTTAGRRFSASRSA